MFSSKMAAEEKEAEDIGSSPPAVLLSSLPDPAATAGLCGSVAEVYLLQASLLRRGRLREAAERERRKRQYLRRRRAFVLSSLSAILSLITTTRRDVWVRHHMPGPTFWTLAESFDDDQWKAQFRVSRTTFDFLLEEVGPVVERRRTNYRNPIEPRRRLAIALWYLACSGEYRSIARLFGVGIATVCMIVRQVTAAILQRLYHRFVSLSDGVRLDDTLRAFRERRCPQCAGAIGITHIPISAPREHPEHYINTEGWHSLILQAVVDQNLCFTDVYAGWPGGSNAAAVLSSSDLYMKAEHRPDGYLFPQQRALLWDHVEIPVHLIGDASFPLKPWLMKSYSEEHSVSPEQQHFGFTLDAARSVVDSAFQRLKGRWRCLLKKKDINVSSMSRVVAACCVLHNICEQQGDSFLPEWSVETVPSGMFPLQPKSEPCHEDLHCSAEVIRHTITYNLRRILQD